MKKSEAKILDNILNRFEPVNPRIYTEAKENQHCETLLALELIEIESRREEGYLIKITPKGRKTVAEGGLIAIVNSTNLDQKVKKMSIVATIISLLALLVSIAAFICANT